MKKLKTIALVLVTALIVSCGDSSEIIQDDVNGEEIVLDAELKAGIQFDPSTIEKPSNFMETVPGGQLLAIETLLNIQAPLLIIDESSTAESLNILDDKLYATRVNENDCGYPTDEYTQRYQWKYLNFSYTTEVGQNSGHNFWITEYKGTEGDETVRVMISGREERGEGVSGCMFISTNEEASFKLEWRISDGGLTEGDTILKYIVYEGDDTFITTMNFKPDGSGSSRNEVAIYTWTVDGVVTFTQQGL